MINGYSIPFSVDVGLPDFARDVIQIKGLVSYSGRQLHLDFQEIDQGLRKLEPRKTNLGLADIGRITYKKRLLSGRIFLTPMRLQALDDMPGVHEGELILNIKRKDREQAMALVSRVRVDLSEARLDEGDQ